MKENKMTDKIRNELFNMQDIKYVDFLRKLIPNIDPETIIGVRTPELRKYAKQLEKDDMVSGFLTKLPHRYFEENQLHSFVISGIKDYKCCMDEVCRFIPYIDNWATCDQLSPKIFKKHRAELFEQIKLWISSTETYTVRFAVGMLMEHFLDEDFDIIYPEMVSEIRSEEYYVNMMIAWYFATALAKQYDAIIPFIEEGRLADWTHNKTISKARESFRITPEQKEYLKGLKR